MAPLKKVVSGGQTGVDRAALDAALACGIEIGGWLPQGHPDARMAPMPEFMMPLAPVRGGGS